MLIIFLIKKFFIFFLYYIFTTALFPHGGGLNYEGCHNNRKIGDYHCHRKKQNRSNQSNCWKVKTTFATIYKLA